MRVLLIVGLSLWATAVMAEAPCRDWAADLVCDPVYSAERSRELVATTSEMMEIVASLKRLENALVQAAEITWAQASSAEDGHAKARARAHRRLDRAIVVCLCRSAWEIELQNRSDRGNCTRPIEDIRNRLIRAP